LRIGLAMDEIRATDQRMQRRLLVMTAVVAVLAVLIVLFLIASRNFKVVSLKYEIIQTLTGNILENMNDAVVTVKFGWTHFDFQPPAEELFGIPVSNAVGRELMSYPH